MKARIEGRPTYTIGNQNAWCKHIDRVYNDVCRWRGELLMDGFTVCPQCGGTVVPIETEQDNE